MPNIVYQPSYNAPFCLLNGLNQSQGIIFDWLLKATHWAEKVQLEDGLYYWVSRTLVCEQLPLVTTKENTAYKHYKQLAAKGVIIFKKDGKKDLIRFTSKAKDYGTIPYVGKKSEKAEIPMSEKNPNSYVGKKSEGTRKKIRHTNKLDLSNKNTTTLPPSQRARVGAPAHARKGASPAGAVEGREVVFLENFEKWENHGLAELTRLIGPPDLEWYKHTYLHYAKKYRQIIYSGFDPNEDHKEFMRFICRLVDRCCFGGEGKFVDKHTWEAVQDAFTRVLSNAITLESKRFTASYLASNYMRIYAGTHSEEKIEADPHRVRITWEGQTKYHELKKIKEAGTIENSEKWWTRFEKAYAFRNNSSGKPKENLELDKAAHLPYLLLFIEFLYYKTDQPETVFDLVCRYAEHMVTFNPYQLAKEKYRERLLKTARLQYEHAQYLAEKRKANLGLTEGEGAPMPEELSKLAKKLAVAEILKPTRSNSSAIERMRELYGTSGMQEVREKKIA